MAHEGDEVALAADLQAQHAEAAVGVVEGHPLDEAREAVEAGLRKDHGHEGSSVQQPSADTGAPGRPYRWPASAQDGRHTRWRRPSSRRVSSCAVGRCLPQRKHDIVFVLPAKGEPGALAV